MTPAKIHAWGGEPGVGSKGGLSGGSNGSCRCSRFWGWEVPAEHCGEKTESGDGEEEYEAHGEVVGGRVLL